MRLPEITPTPPYPDSTKTTKDLIYEMTDRTSPQMLNQLYHRLKDQQGTEAEMQLGTVVRHRNCPEPTQIDAFRRGPDSIRLCVLGNISCSTAVLTQAAKDSQWAIEVAEHPNSTLPVLVTLLAVSGGDGWQLMARKVVLARPDVPEHIKAIAVLGESES